MHLSPTFHIGCFSSAHATTLPNDTNIFLPASLLLTNDPYAAKMLYYIHMRRVTLFFVVPTMLYAFMAAWVSAGSPEISDLQPILNGSVALERSLRHGVSELL